MRARPADDLEQMLNDEPMVELRQAIRDGRRAECARCVCPLWRNLDHATELSLASRRHDP